MRHRAKSELETCPGAEEVARAARGSSPSEIRLITPLSISSSRVVSGTTALHELAPDPERLYDNPRRGRIEEIWANGLGRIEVDRVILSDELMDVLELRGEPVDLRLLRANDAATEAQARRASRIYQQYVRGIPVRSSIYVGFDPRTYEVTSIQGAVLSDDEAPEYREGIDLSAAQSARLVAQKIVGFTGAGARSADDVTLSTPELAFARIGGRFRVGWRFSAASPTGMYTAFVDAKDSTVYATDVRMPAHTCRNSAPPRDDPDYVNCAEEGAFNIVNSDGMCVASGNFCTAEATVGSSSITRTGKGTSQTPCRTFTKLYQADAHLMKTRPL